MVGYGLESRWSETVIEIVYERDLDYYEIDFESIFIYLLFLFLRLF